MVDWLCIVNQHTSGRGMRWDRYRDRKALVESENWPGPSFENCANAASVCWAFETSSRHELLSFKHHQVLAALDSDEAQELLAWCEAPLKNGARESQDRGATAGRTTVSIKSPASTRRFSGWHYNQSVTSKRRVLAGCELAKNNPKTPIFMSRSAWRSPPGSETAF